MGPEIDSLIGVFPFLPGPLERSSTVYTFYNSATYWFQLVKRHFCQIVIQFQSLLSYIDSYKDISNFSLSFYLRGDISFDCVDVVFTIFLFSHKCMIASRIVIVDLVIFYNVVIPILCLLYKAFILLRNYISWF